MNKFAKISIFTLPLIGVGIISAFGFTAKVGLQPGQSVYAFEPTHVTGADAGTKTCPVCKYGFEPGVQVWFNNEKPSTIGFISRQLEAKLDQVGLNKMRVFLVFVEPKSKSDASIRAELKSIAAKNDLKKVALIYVRPDDSSLTDYKVNPTSPVHNYFLTYRNREVVKSYVDLKPSEATSKILTAPF